VEKKRETSAFRVNGAPEPPKQRRLSFPGFGITEGSANHEPGVMEKKLIAERKKALEFGRANPWDTEKGKSRRNSMAVVNPICELKKLNKTTSMMANRKFHYV